MSEKILVTSLMALEMPFILLWYNKAKLYIRNSLPSTSEPKATIPQRSEDKSFGLGLRHYLANF